MNGRDDRRAGVVIGVAAEDVLIEIVDVAGVVVRGLRGRVGRLRSAFTPEQRARKRRAVVRGVDLAALEVVVVRRFAEEVAVRGVGENRVALRSALVGVLDVERVCEERVALLVHVVHQRGRIRDARAGESRLRERRVDRVSRFDRRVARKLVVADGEAAVHGDDFATRVGVDDVLSAEDRKTFDRLGELHVRLSERVLRDLRGVEVFVACPMQKMLLRFQKIFRRFVRSAGAKRSEVACDKGRNAVLILILDLVAGIGSCALLCEGDGGCQEYECCENFLH